ncbi:hypothetical protein LJC68_08560 [Bacteroidales bacterium OttesenSCG-928-B11]|nr:hypothetical protein [Bacteroidales bacterium OttesenSCG-928-B11]
MKKISLSPALIFLLTFCFVPVLSAQNEMVHQPFKGFNIGLTGQMEMVQKVDFIPVGGEEAPPIAFHAMGWETGLELSYHFARYFGFSLGLNVGTINAMKYSIYMHFPKFENRMEDRYLPVLELESEFEFVLPLQFEFHYPLRHNFYFTSSIGVKLKGLYIEKELPSRYSYEHTFWTEEGEDVTFFTLDYRRDMAKTEVDLLLNTGVYYRLPYADFLRLTVGINFALNKYASGYYEFYPYENCSFGFFNMHNNFLYLQFAYIHTFGFMKMKKHVKKSMKPFPSKKERNQYVRELLKL